MRFIKKWIIYSENSGNHVISLADDGMYACDCIGWIRHFPRINCKHIRRVINENPTPVDPADWEALKGKRHKVLAVLNAFKKAENKGIDTQSMKSF